MGSLRVMITLLVFSVVVLVGFAIGLLVADNANSKMSPDTIGVSSLFIVMAVLQIAFAVFMIKKRSSLSSEMLELRMSDIVVTESGCPSDDMADPDNKVTDIVSPEAASSDRK